jgi:hypothetical protein
MKTFREFILEVNRPENGTDVERKRWDEVSARIRAREKPGDWIVGITGRDKNGVQTYGIKKRSSRINQQRNRASRLANIDSDLNPEMKKRGDAKATIIKGRGKEGHHSTSISQSAKEFRNLTPKERTEKREKDAKFGKFHGSDPRNIIQTDGPEGGKGIPHRGPGGYHSNQKPVGIGGSLPDFGSNTEILALTRKASKQGSALSRFRDKMGITSSQRQKPRNTGAAKRMAAAYDRKVDRLVNP